MRAIVQDRYGSAEVLQLRDIGRPVPADDEVLIRVRAAGVDPGVWHLMTGRPYLVRAMGYGIRTPKHRVRGSDAAGIVEAVGKNVTQFRSGEEVYGTTDGSFAEYACSKVERLAPKPARLSFDQAAAVPVSGVTALIGLRDAAKVRPGQRVLIIGASGGVGSFAVQLAKAFGGTVTGVCSTSKLDLVRKIGADDVIDYTREDFTDGSRTFDVILDTAGRRPLRELRRALTPKGTLVIVGGDGGGPWTGGFFRGMLGGPIVSIFVGQTLGWINAKATKEELQALSELIEAGKVTPVVDRTYDLVEAADAVRYLAEGHPAGKIVVTT